VGTFVNQVYHSLTRGILNKYLTENINENRPYQPWRRKNT